LKTVFHPLQKISWIEGYYKQLKAVDDARKNKEHVFFFEHENVITLGTSSKKKDIPETNKTRKSGIGVFQASRGGEATWHGEGQLVVYPVLNIKKRKIQAPKLVEKILRTIQEALFKMDIETHLDLKNPGLYINNKKIASFGMTIKKGITLHGVSININNNQRGFEEIKPCGKSPKTMSTIQRETKRSTNIQLAAMEIKKSLSRTL